MQRLFFFFIYIHTTQTGFKLCIFLPQPPKCQEVSMHHNAWIKGEKKNLFFETSWLQIPHIAKEDLELRTLLLSSP